MDLRFVSDCRWRLGASLVSAMALTGCVSPQVEVSKLNVLLGETVLITSKERHKLLIRSVVANSNEGNADCNKAVGESLSYGETASVLFVGCGKVIEVSVRTDGGVYSGRFER